MRNPIIRKSYLSKGEERVLWWKKRPKNPKIDGYEIDIVEFRNDEEIIEKIEDKDILNSSNMFEKTMKVSSNLKIQVNFVESQKETK